MAQREGIRGRPAAWQTKNPPNSSRVIECPPIATPCTDRPRASGPSFAPCARPPEASNRLLHPARAVSEPPPHLPHPARVVTEPPPASCTVPETPPTLKPAIFRLLQRGTPPHPTSTLPQTPPRPHSPPMPPVLAAHVRRHHCAFHCETVSSNSELGQEPPNNHASR